MNFSIRFDIHFYVFIIFAVVSAGISYLMYHNATDISRISKGFLGLLRALSVFLLLLAVSNLVTDFVRFTSKKREVFVLVDDSKSMSLNDGTVNRPQVTKDVLRSVKGLSSEFDLVPVIFGDHVLLGSGGFDSLKFDQTATNIESALVDVANQSQQNPGQPAFGILLSDGNYNTGGNPVDIARNLSIPIYSAGIGDSMQPKDIAIRQLIPSPSVYAGKKSIVNVIVSSFGFGGKTVTVHLMDDGKEIGSKDLTLSNDGNVESSFDYAPDEVGTHILKAYVAPQKGEATERNNSATATVDVLKGKYSVLLVAGEPSVDVAFLRRNIVLSDDFDLSILVQKDANSFNVPVGIVPSPKGQEGESGHGTGESANPSEILSRKYDAVLLYDFPNSQSSGTLQDVLNILNSTESVSASGVPFAYFAGRNFTQAQISRLPRLPFSVQNVSSEFPGLQNSQNPANSEIQIGISASESVSIPAALQSVNSLLTLNSNLIPPLYYRRVECKPADGSTLLATAVLNGVRLDSPIFYVNQFRRSAAFLAYGLWRTQLMSSLSGLSDNFLQDFLTTLIRTLISSGKQKLLNVYTDKKIYDPSETVNMNALLVDQFGSPISDAIVEVNIRKERNHQVADNVQLNQTGEGSYSGSVSGLGEGKYFYVAQANSNSAFLGADSGTIVVEPMNAEFVQTSMNVQLMRQIASVTGGEFMTPAEFMHGGLKINPEWKQPIRQSNVSRFELLSSLPILAVVFVLLSIEWVTRKIFGLP